MIKKIIFGLLGLLGLGLFGLGLVWFDVFGKFEGPGKVTAIERAAPDVTARHIARKTRAARLGAPADKQILFGDLHVHTTYSFDAFMQTLPANGGQGSMPVADACDFARFCSALDFWSINDHAGGLDIHHWETTKEAIRQCNAVAADPANPDTVAFLGWEWTNVGTKAENHWGHKNVIFRDTDEAKVPARPIAAAQGFHTIAKTVTPNMARGLAVFGTLAAPKSSDRLRDIAHFLLEANKRPDCDPSTPVRDLPTTCAETAEKPNDLFAKLDDWGYPALVIPHGNAWGLLSPAASSWEKDLAEGQIGPQKLIEVYSGHGNSEEYRSWRHAVRDGDGKLTCPAPHDGFTPNCWRAGEIIAERCIAEGTDAATCEERAQATRQYFLDGGMQGFLSVPGADANDWLEAGQCTDCFMPTFSHRPMKSTQYALALRRFNAQGKAERFRFGMVAASDTHRARPGTGYKAVHRYGMTDVSGPRSKEQYDQIMPKDEPAAEGRAVDDTAFALGSQWNERRSSFLTTGGLVAVHAPARDRNAIFNALDNKQSYATSGPRILLWFDMLDEAGNVQASMGDDTYGNAIAPPRFRVRAAGAFKQKPGCPSAVSDVLTPERIQSLCMGECYNPSDERLKITRIEVVRIRPQTYEGEPVDDLIESPWKVLPCNDEGEGCVVDFVDREYPDAGRDTVYYVRAIQEPTDKVNGDLLRCERDGEGNCTKANACVESYRTPMEDDCLAPTEERAWSSPIFVDWNGASPSAFAAAKP